MTQGDPVLVTTDKRGVFFGYYESSESRPGEGVSVTLTKARNCVYWDAATKGFLGLAANGPGPGCRIGPAADRLVLFGVTSTAVVAKAAVKNWEGAPWAS